VPTIAIDSKGRITSASNTNIAFPVTTVNGASGTVVLTTSNIAEGSNQYFTSARAQASITGGASSVVTADLTASRALVSDGSGKISASASTTATEIGYVAGVTSAIQTQLNTKALDSNTVHITGTETITGAKTFSSALGGTSATFSGAGYFGGATSSSGLTGASELIIQNEIGIQNTDTTGPYLRMIAGGVNQNITLVTGAFSGTEPNLLFSVGGTTRLTIAATTGAATFNGTVGIGNAATSTSLMAYQGNSSLNVLDISHVNGNGLKINASYNYYDAYNHIFRGLNGSTTYLTITNSGDLMVGNGTAAARLHVYTGDAGTVTSQGGTVAIFENGAHTRLQIQSPDTFSPQIYFSSPSYPNSGSIDQYCAAVGVAYMGFNQGGTERARITGNGYLKASNTGSYGSTTSSSNEFNSNQADWTLVLRNTHSSAPYGHYVEYVGTSPNSTGSEFLYCRDSSTIRTTIRSNGGLANFQANNVNLSDERTKKDIIPLESYWDKFKAIEIVKFKYKDQTHDDFNIGVIAQQVESVAPEFVDVDGWDKPQLDEEGNEIISNEEPLKAIYTADLHHATIKVLQEAMSKIETLEAKIAILEAK
jgi:hypothetical protein